jgi:ADP-ribose pyrophosphatase YjhB (NUDIX family)
MAIRHQLAQIIRRTPALMLLPYYTYRFFQPKYSVGVIGVVMNGEGKILLVEHVFHPRLPWSLPGGWINFNEDPAEAVERELSEELSLTVDAHRLLLMERTQFNHLDIAYLCQAKSEIGTLSYELLAYKWFAPDELPQLHGFHYQAIQRALGRD